MAKVNKTRYALLGVLNARPCSGYDIKKYCDKSISHFWNENFGHIYPVLKQMEEDGLIEKKVENNEGKLSRNVYFITQKGREEFLEWLMSPMEEQSPPRLELLLKLTFAKNVPHKYIIEDIKRVKEKHAKRLEEYLKIEEVYVVDEKAKKDSGYPYWLATLRYGIYDAQFRVKWCEETIESIRSYKASVE